MADDDAQTQIIDAARDLTLKVNQLSKSLTISKAQQQKQKRNQNILALVVVLVAAALVTVTVAFFQERHTQHQSDTRTACITRWSDQYTKRASVLTTLANERTDALDQLVRSLQGLKSGLPPTSFQSELAKYLQTSDNYAKAVKNNPIPPSPQLNCK